MGTHREICPEILTQEPGPQGKSFETFASLFSVPESPLTLLPILCQCLGLSYLRLSCVLGEMVRQARILAQATSDLVNAIKADAEGESDLENSRKLLSAAKILADATAKMVEAAKVQSRFLYRP